MLVFQSKLKRTRHAIVTKKKQKNTSTLVLVAVIVTPIKIVICLYRVTQIKL